MPLKGSRPHRNWRHGAARMAGVACVAAGLLGAGAGPGRAADAVQVGADLPRAAAGLTATVHAGDIVAERCTSSSVSAGALLFMAEATSSSPSAWLQTIAVMSSNSEPGMVIALRNERLSAYPQWVLAPGSGTVFVDRQWTSDRDQSVRVGWASWAADLTCAVTVNGTGLTSRRLYSAMATGHQPAWSGSYGSVTGVATYSDRSAYDQYANGFILGVMSGPAGGFSTAVDPSGTIRRADSGQVVALAEVSKGFWTFRSTYTSTYATPASTSQPPVVALGFDVP